MGVEKEEKNPGVPRISGPMRSQFKQVGAEELGTGFGERVEPCFDILFAPPR